MPALKLTINGQERELKDVENVAGVIEGLGMRLDRVAVELNRELVPRDRWSETPVRNGDRLEIVHFVGGGAGLAFGSGSPKALRNLPSRLVEP